MKFPPCRTKARFELSAHSAFQRVLRTQNLEALCRWHNLNVLPIQIYHLAAQSFLRCLDAAFIKIQLEAVLCQRVSYVFYHGDEVFRSGRYQRSIVSEHAVR